MTTAKSKSMEAIDFYQVDSFTSVRFRGAPAGVCVLEPGAEWPKVGAIWNVPNSNLTKHIIFQQMVT